MKIKLLFPFPVIAILALSACGETKTSLAPDTENPPTGIAQRTNTPRPVPEATDAPPEPTAFSTSLWSTTASTRTELSFAFPGNWDGSSPLTFGEGEFVKDPDQPIGVTFRIKLSGEPANLLGEWGKNDIGIVGIVTFTPESVSDGPALTVARLDADTKIAQGEGITARVVYLPRADDVLEIMWFAPTERWEELQPVFQGVLDSVELWRKFTSMELGLSTMYLHDWLKPIYNASDASLWFQSADKRTGLLVYARDEVADPAEKLGEWTVDRLEILGYSQCTLKAGDRMDTLSGKWESKMGECTDAQGGKTVYEIAIIPNKDRLLEFITYAPAEAWEEANDSAFRYLLGLMTDFH